MTPFTIEVDTSILLAQDEASYACHDHNEGTIGWKWHKAMRYVRLTCQPTSQQYCSLILNQHQPSTTSQSAVLFSHNKSTPSISQANTAIPIEFIQLHTMHLFYILNRSHLGPAPIVCYLVRSGSKSFKSSCLLLSTELPSRFTPRLTTDVCSM